MEVDRARRGAARCAVARRDRGDGFARFTLVWQPDRDAEDWVVAVTAAAVETAVARFVAHRPWCRLDVDPAIGGRHVVCRGLVPEAELPAVLASCAPDRLQSLARTDLESVVRLVRRSSTRSTATRSETDRLLLTRVAPALAAPDPGRTSDGPDPGGWTGGAVRAALGSGSWAIGAVTAGRYPAASLLKSWPAAGRPGAGAGLAGGTPTDLARLARTGQAGIADLRIGLRCAAAPGSPDRLGWSVLNHAFGGWAGSRLSRLSRQAPVYHLESVLRESAAEVVLIVVATVRTDRLEWLETEVYRRIRALWTEDPPTDGELDRAVGMVTGEILRRTARQGGLADWLARRLTAGDGDVRGPCSWAAELAAMGAPAARSLLSDPSHAIFRTI